MLPDARALRPTTDEASFDKEIADETAASCAAGISYETSKLRLQSIDRCCLRRSLWNRIGAASLKATSHDVSAGTQPFSASQSRATDASV